MRIHAKSSFVWALSVFAVSCVSSRMDSGAGDTELTTILDGHRRIAQEIDPLLRSLGEGPIGKGKLPGSEFAVRLVLLPSRGPVKSYRIEELSSYGPIIAAITVTDGGISGKQLAIAYSGRRLVDSESFDHCIREVVLGSIECFDRPLTTLQPVHLDTTAAILEVYGRDWCRVLLRHEPLAGLSTSVVADARIVDPSVSDEDVVEEQQLRANLARLISWLECFWGLRVGASASGPDSGH